jgi:hypothetical protein
VAHRGFPEVAVVKPLNHHAPNHCGPITSSHQCLVRGAVRGNGPAGTLAPRPGPTPPPDSGILTTGQHSGRGQEAVDIEHFIRQQAPGECSARCVRTLGGDGVLGHRASAAPLVSRIGPLRRVETRLSPIVGCVDGHVGWGSRSAPFCPGVGFRGLAWPGGPSRHVQPTMGIYASHRVF